MLSSTHQVLTATLCNESKRKRISVPSLDQRPLKLLKSSNRQPTGPSKSRLYHLGSPLTEIDAFADNVGAKNLAAGPGKHARLFTRPHQWDCTSRRWLLRRLPRKDRPCTCLRLLLCWLARPTIQHDWTAPTWDQTLAEYLEWSYDQGATQDMASETLAAVRWPLPNLPRPMSRSFSSATACLQGWKHLEPGSSCPPAPRLGADTKSMHACPWWWPKSRQSFSSKYLDASATWNDSGESFNACGHWCHFKHRTRFPFHLQRSPSCWFDIMRSWVRIFFLDPARGPAFGIGQPGVASRVLLWLAAGRVLGMWCGTPSLDFVQRNAQVLEVGRFLRAIRNPGRWT